MEPIAMKVHFFDFSLIMQGLKSYIVINVEQYNKYFNRSQIPVKITCNNFKHPYLNAITCHVQYINAEPEFYILSLTNIKRVDND